MNDHTKDSLYRKTGLTYDQMQQMSAEEIDAFIECRIGRKLTPAAYIKGLVSRGSAYLYSGRLMPMHVVDKRLAKI